jgi:hypothetical protein
MKFYLFFGLILVFTLTTVSCGGRVPDAKTAQSVSTRYFSAYGKKYPETTFGQKNVEMVKINTIEEISHNTALADTIVHFFNGHVGRALVKMEKKFPGGWRVVSWEMLQYR